MEIELTSVRDDDTFTWRAAGALKPRGTVGSSVLPPGSKVGDVVRVEAEVELEGITILAVIPPKEKESAAGRIEVVGSQPPVAAVTTVLAGPSERKRPSRFFDGEDRRPRRPAGERRSGAPGGDRRPAPAGGDRRLGPGAGEGRSGDSPRGGRRTPGAEVAGGAPAQSSGSGQRDGGSRSGESRRAPGDGRGAGRGGREARPLSEQRPSSRRPDRREPGPGRSRPEPAERDEARPGRDRSAPARRGAFRLEPGTAHRDALMDTLAPEHRPIVERLAAGGMPAVRKAVADEQERARAEGRPDVSGDAIVALAEGLLPDVKAALWLDRAEAAAAHLEELSLRDLRATVVTASARDDSGRDLARQLREALDRRLAKLRSDWEQRLEQALAGGRILQALRLSAEPPDSTARFPAAFIERLAAQAGAGMKADLSPDRWLALLDAAAACPVRRQIKPAGIPQDPSGEVTRRARLAAGRIPALAPMLGMTMPPPPQPLPGGRPSRPPRPSRPRPGRPAPGSPGPRGPTAGREERALAADAAPPPPVRQEQPEHPVEPVEQEQPAVTGEDRAEAQRPVEAVAGHAGPQPREDQDDGRPDEPPAAEEPEPAVSAEPVAAEPAGASGFLTGKDPVVGEPLGEPLDKR
jgi:hypothetical protein